MNKEIVLLDVVKKACTYPMEPFDIHEMNACMLEFGRQLLEIASEDAKAKASKMNVVLPKEIEQSILDVIKKVKP